MRLYVDASPLYNLGQTGALDVLLAPDWKLVVLPGVRDEITVEPAKTNLTQFLDENPVRTVPPDDEWLDEATKLLDGETVHSDVHLIGGLLGDRANGIDTALVSDDRRMRAVGEALGSTVTGTFGVIVRASLDDKYFSTAQLKRLVRRVDHHGVQMTGTLRERAVGSVE